MLNAIAIDDEPIALEVIRNLASRLDTINVRAYFTNAFRAREYIAENNVDLLFLDIKMPDINGIDFMAGLEKSPLVIFTTAYSEHAVKGFELNALDYLLKPFSFERFRQACERANKLYQLKELAKTSNEPLLIKSGYDTFKIAPEKILYLQSAGNYIQFVLADKKITSRLTMAEAIETIPESLFIRIHRSYIVNISHINMISRDSVYVGSAKLPLSDLYAEEVATKLKMES